MSKFSVSQNELLDSLNMIKNYIDNNAIEVKQEGQYIYYKFLAETDDEWKILLDCSSLTIINGSIDNLKQIELYNDAYEKDKNGKNGEGNIYWKYKGELRKHTLLKAHETKGPQGDVFIPTVSKDGMLSWERKSGNDVKDIPQSVNVKGEAYLPDNIIVNVTTGEPDFPANVEVKLSEDKQSMIFDFRIPRGKNGSIRMDNYKDLADAVGTGHVIDAIIQLNNKIIELESIINDLKKD